MPADNSEYKARKSRKEREEYVKARLAEMVDVATGVVGSEGTISLSPAHGDVFLDELEGEAIEELGGGGLVVSCKHLCDALEAHGCCTFEKPEPPEEKTPVRRRKIKKKEEEGAPA